KDLGDRLARETMAAMGWMEYPADFRDAALLVGQPQQDVPDRDAAMLDDQRKRASLAIEAGLAQALGELVAGDFRGPRLIQQVAGNVRSRVQLVKPFGIACLMQTEPKPLRRQRPLGAEHEIAPVMEQLPVLSCGRGPDAP